MLLATPPGETLNAGITLNDNGLSVPSQINTAFALQTLFTGKQVFKLWQDLLLSDFMMPTTNISYALYLNSSNKYPNNDHSSNSSLSALLDQKLAENNVLTTAEWTPLPVVVVLPVWM